MPSVTQEYLNNYSCVSKLRRVTTLPPSRPDASRLAALQHPVRRRVVEILALDGPATVSQIAHRSAQAVGNVSHHLKILGRAGLAEEAPELARDKRERWWRQVPAPRIWSVADVGEVVADRIIVEEAERENLAYQVSNVEQWWSRRQEYEEKWVQAAFEGVARVRLTADELTELGRRIDALIRDFGTQPSGDDQPRESVFVFAHAVPSEP